MNIAHNNLAVFAISQARERYFLRTATTKILHGELLYTSNEVVTKGFTCYSIAGNNTLTLR